MADDLDITDLVSCKTCQTIGGQARSFRVTRSFTTAPIGSVRPVIWRPPLVIPLTLRTPPDAATEWGYSIHALLAHPESRGAYMALCVVAAKVEPVKSGKRN